MAGITWVRRRLQDGAWPETLPASPLQASPGRLPYMTSWLLESMEPPSSDDLDFRLGNCICGTVLAILYQLDTS